MIKDITEHNLFLCGIIKGSLDDSQTAKDITKEKICVVDGFCAVSFFSSSTK